jgi:hypothetical protein
MKEIAYSDSESELASDTEDEEKIVLQPRQKKSSFQNQSQVMLKMVADRLWPIPRLSKGHQIDLSY